MNEVQPLPPAPPPPRRGGLFSLGCLMVFLLGVLVIGVGFVAIIIAAVSHEPHFLSGGAGVALLEIHEELFDERQILADLEELVDNPATQALVIRVDSPGGVITVVEEIYDALRRVRDEKHLPIVASMGAVAASGGYFVCLPADEIYANNSSLTGSIGVIIEYPNAESLLQKVGVSFLQIKSGEYKGAGSFMEGLTDRQQEHMQKLVDDFHSYFVEVVMVERGLSAETMAEIADGRLFTGREAVKIGLADDIGDLDAAIKHAARLAGLDDEDPRVIRVWDESPFFPQLMQQIESVSASVGRSWMLPKYVMR